MSNAKDENLLGLVGDKSYEMEDEGFSIENSKSMMLSRNDRGNTSLLSRYLTIPSRLNETVISSDRTPNRFSKKIILQKDKEIEEKQKELEDISLKYEEKLSELNKSRNEDREKYEKQIKSFRSELHTIKHNKSRYHRQAATRSNTPVATID